jgi:hypothetical protein
VAKGVGNEYVTICASINSAWACEPVPPAKLRAVRGKLVDTAAHIRHINISEVVASDAFSRDSIECKGREGAAASRSL